MTLAVPFATSAIAADRARVPAQAVPERPVKGTPWGLRGLFPDTLPNQLCPPRPPPHTTHNCYPGRGFTCFLLPSGIEEFAPLYPAGLAAAMDTIAGFGGLLSAHAEDPAIIDAATAEVTAVEALLAQTRRTGCRTHVVHLSSAAALPLIRAAKEEGLPVTAETCPHYLLTLRAEEVPDGATQFTCCPPIRDDANRELLWAGLLDGTIDCVVSDHSLCPADVKHLDTGDFGAAEPLLDQGLDVLC